MERELVTLNEGNMGQKRWIVMDTRNFKKAVMRLNTKNAEMIRDYYLNLEEACFEYSEYQAGYMVQKGEYLLTIKDTELQEEKERAEQEKEELEEKLVRAERKAIRVNKFMRRVVIKEKKLEWIYIATTKMYSQERLFKVGSTSRLSSRISGYNTGRPKEDSYYYCWVKKCYNSKDLDYHIQKLLNDFKHKENTELYCGIKFADLKDIVNFIVDNYDESIDYINNFIRTRLNESLEEEDEEPPRLDYKKITYQIGEHTETIDLEKEDSEVIKDELDNILASIKEQHKSTEREETVVVNRKVLLEKLVKVTNIPKKELWNHIKEYTGWTNSKSEIDEGSFKYKIEY
jgi:hypothetical protein